MSTLRSFFSFRGRTRRLPYALFSIGIFLAQYLMVLFLFAEFRQSLSMDWRFFAMPLRSLAALSQFPVVAFPIALALTIFFSWLLVLLAFRRANDAGMPYWIAAAAMAPIIQVVAILVLCFAPSRDPGEASPDAEVGRIDWRAATQGVLAGVALTLLSVVFGALVFGTYGFGMFVVSPLIVGATTGYLANRGGDIGWWGTMQVITVSLILGGIGLVVAALEGIVCIVLASPLALGAALLGGAFGRSAARSRNRPARNTLMSIAILPAVFATEYALPPDTFFSTTETIDIQAPADAVWMSIIHMDTIKARPDLPFRLGVAYPIRGEIIGAGVGAVRKGVFSTGVALERVTEWKVDRKLAFAVLSSPPAMIELSPYRHVNAPHVNGYFRTMYTSFEIVPFGHDRCRVIEHTTHELRLDPILYWMPFARLIIHENNMRVLSHLREQAEHVGSVEKS